MSKSIHIGPCIAERLHDRLIDTEHRIGCWTSYRLPGGPRIAIGTETVYWFPDETHLTEFEILTAIFEALHVDSD